MISSWERQSECWRRFAAWENDRLRATPPDFERSLAWMAEAWDLAERHSPGWGAPPSVESHWRHLREIQGRLARAFGQS